MPKKATVVKLPDGTEFRVGLMPDGRINLYIPGRWHLGGFFAGKQPSGKPQTNVGLVPDEFDGKSIETD